MKFRKMIFMLFISVIVLSFVSKDVYAFPSHKKHDDMLESILFPLYEHDLKNNDESVKALEAIEYASYLTIDQRGDNGKDKLEKLKEYGIKGLPKSTTDPGYYIAGVGENHRKPTHRGWDYDNYTSTPKDYEIWKNRRPILENTVDKFFDFNGDDKQKESFCAIIYYIHILGDRYDDCNNNRKYYPPSVIMELGGRKNDEKDIIHELEKYIRLLFKNSINESNNNYDRIIRKLEEINIELEPIVTTQNAQNLNDNTSDEFQIYCKCAEEALNMFQNVNSCKEEQFSILLKSEPFFNKVFYKHQYPQKRYV
ncbi:hypothetical protein [Ruminococcus sp. XPD3002]|uniref:hypothetical protein n=1 Tax=Ruminococcus sp. XPD3002 TaxID=1452269 RepID=UPI0009219802|nr:hypothetical protein SAMN04487832_12125 [Ruminococcus flavefaciens]